MRASSMIGRPIDAQGGGLGAKMPHLERNLALAVRCSMDRGQGRAVFSLLAYVTGRGQAKRTGRRRPR